MHSRLPKHKTRLRGLALTPGPSPNTVGEGRLESAQADFVLFQVQFQLPQRVLPPLLVKAGLFARFVEKAGNSLALNSFGGRTCPCSLVSSPAPSSVLMPTWSM